MLLVYLGRPIVVFSRIVVKVRMKGFSTGSDDGDGDTSGGRMEKKKNMEALLKQISSCG
jgi:hypothetical protein